MGDAVISLSSLQYIRERFPDKNLVFAVPSWIAPLFENVEIAADEVIGLDFKGIKSWTSNIQKLKKLKIGTVFELFMRGSSHKFFTMFSFLFGAKYLFHNHHVRKETGVIDQGVIKSNIQRDLDGLASLLVNEKPPEYLLYQPKMIPKHKIDKDGSIILGIVATRQTKQWEIKNFVELANELNSIGRKVRIPIAPSELDQKLKKDFIKLAGNELVEFVEVPLSQLPLEVAKSDFYIGNDTGLKHISAALGLKTITLFGPEPPLEWHPYDTTRHPYFYKEPLECRVRKAHYCGLSECDSMICLNEFTAAQVLSKFQEISSKS